MSSIKKLTLTGMLKSKMSRCSPGVDFLWCKGEDAHNLTYQPWVAVVGTRKPTAYGTSLVQSIVGELARAGVVIVSGLAYGIDVLAHRVALEAGGTTIGVLPSDLHKIYPSGNRRVAEDICKAGCLLSEYDDNPYPMAHQFLSRNRIIAALADLVWIPEASERSGSLNTANHAKNMNITVCVSPGRSTDPMSAGTNRLLQTQAARLITSAQDIYDILSIKPNQSAMSAVQSLTDIQKNILETIGGGVSDTTLLAHSLKLGTAELLYTLTELEILDLVQQNNAGQWTTKI